MYILEFKNTLLLKTADHHLMMQGYHKPSVCKKKKNNNKAVSAKCNKVKHKKTRYDYIYSL